MSSEVLFCASVAVAEMPIPKNTESKVLENVALPLLSVVTFNVARYVSAAP